jgi:hypothetical protein
MNISLYTIFHLNISYSAIEEEQNLEVINKCYWPLLELIINQKIPIAIEASALTLIRIRDLCPNWIKVLKTQLKNGNCIFIASGYSQSIAPINPYILNKKNLQLGLEKYWSILSYKPKFVLVNEQAYSSGLIKLYKELGFRAMIMEWENSYKVNPKWKKKLQFNIQNVSDTQGNSLPVIWNHSIIFQKFQRYAHGEIDLKEFIGFFNKYKNSEEIFLPLYGNDIEVFDFRPGRYMSESKIIKDGEWNRIIKLYEFLKKSKKFNLINLEDFFEISQLKAKQTIVLENAANPIPVKKQGKYNILRWSLTGRNDIDINTKCWGIYQAMVNQIKVSDTDWAELCYLISSDFRTHITPKRWNTYNQRLMSVYKKWINESLSYVPISAKKNIKKPCKKFEIKKDGHFIIISSDNTFIKINRYRGLSIDKYINNNISKKPLFGTIPHGTFDDIDWSADFYSGHLVFQEPGKPKVTDLVEVNPKFNESKTCITLTSSIKTINGPIIKEIIIPKDESYINLKYKINWSKKTCGVLRLGYITLFRKSFENKSIQYITNNGGNENEKFYFSNKSFDHSEPISSLISANQCLGMTEGKFYIGDGKKLIKVSINKHELAALGLVTNIKINQNFFTRFALSILEKDDTSKFKDKLKFNLSIKIEAIKNIL